MSCTNYIYCVLYLLHIIWSAWRHYLNREAVDLFKMFWKWLFWRHGWWLWKFRFTERSQYQAPASKVCF